jgi:acyl CoA:acetate/3-ketoacid CoA transferase alpha subunit
VITFGNSGLHVTFLLVVAAALSARLTGRWQPGGTLQVELCPQGTLAERLRAGGAGIPAFFTPAGVGTAVAEGGLPWRYDSAGGVAVASPPKETRLIKGREYLFEQAVTTDYALVHAHTADRHSSTADLGPSSAGPRWAAFAGSTPQRR